MKYSDVKSIIEFCENNYIDHREVIENMLAGEIDFMVDDYRFIAESDIDQIQTDELKSDPYILGSFTDWFIADNSDLSYDIVKALQEGEKYEELGQHLIDNDCVSDMQYEYQRLDGYGHHFASYDGYTLEDLIGLSFSFYVFRIN